MTAPRPVIVASAIIFLGIFLTGSLSSGPQESAGTQYTVTDDISNRGDIGASAAWAPSQGGSGSGNNGHGNNMDGVDSSNPGRGGPGPDQSCTGAGPCIDDEMP